LGAVALCSGVLVNYLEVALFFVAVVLNAQNGRVLVHNPIRKERKGSDFRGHGNTRRTRKA
jgi:hypothetical protein